MLHRPLARARIGGGRVGLSEVARARPKATQGPSTGRGAVGPAQSRGHLLVKPCSDPDFWLLCPTCSVRARATRAKVGFLGPALHCSGAILSSSALEGNIRLFWSFDPVSSFVGDTFSVQTSPVEMWYCQSRNGKATKNHILL